MTRHALLTLTLLTALACDEPGPGDGDAGRADAGRADGGAMRLVWSDEFDGAEGSGVDPAKWRVETGGHGFGNNELQYYRDSRVNLKQSQGNLVITATRQDAAQYTCSAGPCQYTSARVNTSGKFEVTYGRIEARLKLPRGQGIWPAFWMLGADLATAGWPACGEIDVMENVGHLPTTVHGTLHGPGYSGGSGLTASLNSPTGAAFGDDFHVYAVEWSANRVRFLVDGAVYRTRTPADLPGGASWVFNRPFFLLLNLAVGGNWPGPPDGTTQFPQQLLVDYVRVYQE